jgi:hypothetical protein
LIASLVFSNLCLVPCVPNVVNVSGLSIFFLLRLFVLCLVYPMLSVSLDCTFLIAPLVFSNFCPVPFIPNVVNVSGLYILDCPWASQDK